MRLMVAMNSSDKKTILITGASGMVGRALQTALSHLHHLLTPTRAEVDYTDKSATHLYFKKTKPDFVFHLAAKVGGIAANIADPVGFFYETMQINLNVIHAAYQTGVPKFLYVGSSCMYPKDREILTESDLLTGELEPTNEGYAFSKLAGMLFCNYLNTQYHTKYKTIIPTNLYGEHDHFDEKRSHLVPAIILKVHNAMKTKNKIISIWGDGEARREFMYIGDLVNALLKAFFEFDTLPTVTNIGLGYDYSVNDYYHIVAKMMDYQGEFRHDLNKPTGMQRKHLDVSKATAWGFTANTSITEGVQRVYDYALKHKKLI